MVVYRAWMRWWGRVNWGGLGMWNVRVGMIGCRPVEMWWWRGWDVRVDRGRVVLMAQRLVRRDWRSGGPRFKSHPRLTSQSWSSYQLNQLGSKAASDSTLKQLTTCGVSNTCTLLGMNVWRMIWRCMVYMLNGQCSGICGGASIREERLTLAERGRNGRFKNKWWWWWWWMLSKVSNRLVNFYWYCKRGHSWAWFAPWMSSVQGCVDCVCWRGLISRQTSVWP